MDISTRGSRKYDLILDVEKVRRCMFDQAIGVQKLAAKIGVNEHTLSRYLKNPEKVKLETVADIAAALTSSPYFEDFIKRVERVS